MHHQRGNKLRVPDAHAEGRGLVEMPVGLLWAVRSRTRSGRGVAEPLGPALHGEGRLSLPVDVRVGASVLSRSRCFGEILGRSAGCPPAWEAVAGAGRFIGDLGTQQSRKSVAGGFETKLFRLRKTWRLSWIIRLLRVTINTFLLGKIFQSVSQHLPGDYIYEQEQTFEGYGLSPRWISLTLWWLFFINTKTTIFL